MPSERYYRQQATALLSWARATTDKAWANVLRQRAARELERAAETAGAITDLNPLLAEFNEQQMRKAAGEVGQAADTAGATTDVNPPLDLNEPQMREDDS